MNEPKNSAADLTAKITKHISNLAQMTDESLRSEAMLSFIKMCSRFHHYSVGNLWLILIQKPDATQVAGYHTWLQLHRYVRRGEKGIPILAPCVTRQNPDDKESEKVVRYFKVVYVFDISQTEGEPLPDPPDWTSPERQVWLEDRLVQLARDLGIVIKREKLSGTAQGKSSGGVITLTPEAGTTVLVHEIAHELMHQHAGIDRQTCEIEAESVAAVVCSHFGLDNGHASNYLALWGADSKAVLSRLDRIRQTVSQIITSLEAGADRFQYENPEPRA